MQLVMSASQMAYCFIFMPKRPNDMALLQVGVLRRGRGRSVLLPAAPPSPAPPSGSVCASQVWLQEFAWTERDVQRKRAERSSSLPPDSFESFCMDCEPMFCFEVRAQLASRPAAAAARTVWAALCAPPTH